MKKTSCLICVFFTIHCITPLASGVANLLTSSRALRSSSEDPKTVLKPQMFWVRTYSAGSTSGNSRSKSLPSPKNLVTPGSKSSKSSTISGRRRAHSLGFTKSSSKPRSARRASAPGRLGRSSSALNSKPRSKRNTKPVSGFVVTGKATDFEDIKKRDVIPNAAQIKFYIPTSTVVVDVTEFSTQVEEVTGIRVRDVRELFGSRFLDVELLIRPLPVEGQLQRPTLPNSGRSVLLRKEIPNGRKFHIGDMITTDEGLPAVHIATDTQFLMVVDFSTNEFCTAYIRYFMGNDDDDDVYVIIPLELYPYIDKANNLFKASVLNSPDEKPVVIHKEIPEGCKIEDEFPALTLIHEVRHVKVALKVGKRNNLEIVEGAEEIEFKLSVDVCVVEFDVSNRFEAAKDGVQISRVRPHINRSRWAEIHLEFNDDSKVILKKKIPTECARWTRRPWDMEVLEKKDDINIRLKVTYGTTRPEIYEARFESSWDRLEIVMEQTSCQATVDLAGQKCQAIKEMFVKKVFPKSSPDWGQTLPIKIPKNPKQYLVVVSDCTPEEEREVVIPKYLGCAVTEGKIDIVEQATGYYTTTLGTQKTTLIFKK